jgi:hypothetical protein
MKTLIAVALLSPLFPVHAFAQSEFYCGNGASVVFRRRVSVAFDDVSSDRKGRFRHVDLNGARTTVMCSKSS